MFFYTKFNLEFSIQLPHLIILIIPLCKAFIKKLNQSQAIKIKIFTFLGISCNLIHLYPIHIFSK